MLYSSNPTINADWLRSNYSVPTVTELREEKRGRNGLVPKGVGNRWNPLHHADLIQEILDAAGEAQLTPVEQSYDLSKDGHDLFGYIQFQGLEGFGRTDMAPVLGFRHSNMQRFRLLGVTGGRVFLCANGMIAGNFVFGMKHSTNKMGADLEQGIREGMGIWEAQALQIKATVEALESAEVTDDQAAKLLLESARRDIVPVSQLLKVDTMFQGYRDPAHPHHEAFAPRTAWSLYNAVTEVGKGWRPRRVEKALGAFPRMAGEVLGVHIPSAVDAELVAV